MQLDFLSQKDDTNAKDTKQPMLSAIFCPHLSSYMLMLVLQCGSYWSSFGLCYSICCATYLLCYIFLLKVLEVSFTWISKEAHARYLPFILLTKELCVLCGFFSWWTTSSEYKRDEIRPPRLFDKVPTHL